MAKRRDLPVQLISGRPCFIAKPELVMAFRELLHHALNHGRRAADVTEEAHLATAPRVGNRHRNLLLRCVQTDENFAILPHGSSSLCVRLCAGLSSATLARHIPQDEPPAWLTNIRSSSPVRLRARSRPAGGRSPRAATCRA